MTLPAWGLTGGIAAGKSVAARMLAEAGCPVLDADALTKELSAPGGLAHAAIVARFGTADRAQLRDIVFANAPARKELEGILHPWIISESQKRIEALAKTAPVGRPVIYEAALLVETGRYKDLKGLIVVEAPHELRVQRLIARDRCTEEQARRILAIQTSDEERRAVAQHVLINDGSEEKLRSQVLALLAQAL